MAWRAIYCEPRREFLAQRELVAARNMAGRRIVQRAFCPHEIVKERKALASGKARIVETQKPYFPGYLFAETDQIKAVEECRGVVAVLKHGTGEPMSVSPKDMKLLLDAADAFGTISWQDATKLSRQFHGRPGDIFEFVAGGFKGRCGKIASITDLDSRGKVAVIIQAFGGERETSVSHHDIGAILKTA